MSHPSARFDFRKRVAYDAEAKRLFHCHAQRQLKALAAALDLTDDQYADRVETGLRGRRLSICRDVLSEFLSRGIRFVKTCPIP